MVTHLLVTLPTLQRPMRHLLLEVLLPRLLQASPTEAVAISKALIRENCSLRFEANDRCGFTLLNTTFIYMLQKDIYIIIHMRVCIYMYAPVLNKPNIHIIMYKHYVYEPPSHQWHGPPTHDYCKYC